MAAGEAYYLRAMEEMGMCIPAGYNVPIPEPTGHLGDAPTHEALVQPDMQRPPIPMQLAGAVGEVGLGIFVTEKPDIPPPPVAVTFRSTPLPEKQPIDVLDRFQTLVGTEQQRLQRAAAHNIGTALPLLEEVVRLDEAASALAHRTLRLMAPDSQPVLAARIIAMHAEQNPSEPLQSEVHNTPPAAAEAPSYSLGALRRLAAKVGRLCAPWRRRTSNAVAKDEADAFIAELRALSPEDPSPVPSPVHDRPAKTVADRVRAARQRDGVYALQQTAIMQEQHRLN